jgi:hypothetical protein
LPTDRCTIHQAVKSKHADEIFGRDRGLRVKAYAFLLGPAMHEQGFAALVTAVLHKRRPDSEVHFGKRRTGNWSTYRAVSVRETDRSP